MNTRRTPRRKEQSERIPRRERIQRGPQAAPRISMSSYVPWQSDLVPHIGGGVP